MRERSRMLIPMPTMRVIEWIGKDRQQWKELGISPLSRRRIKKEDMKSNMSFDSRGVLRGGCTECSCPGYDGGIEMKKCIQCSHTPGKHKNASTYVGSPSTASGQVTSSHTTPHNLGGGFHSSTAPMSHRYDGSMPQSVYQPSHHHNHHHHQPRQLQLPQCQANGCFKPVHSDLSLPEGLREFAYCSPECRDRHLLPMERVNLTVDLNDLKKKLQEVAAAEKRSPSSVLQRQSSYERSSRVATSSSSSAMATPFGGGHALGGYSSRGSSSSSTSVGGDRILDLSTSGKQAKEQVTSRVMILKGKYEDLGVLLSKTPYCSAKAVGFLVVGVIPQSKAHSKLKDGKIRIFDVIEKVNDRSCDHLLTQGKDAQPQQCFDRHLEDRVSVYLYLSHFISLPPISELLTKAQRPFTHLIALRYSPACTEKAYGLTLSSGIYNKVLVGGRTTDTPAYHSGLEFGDEIRMYAVASADAIGDVEEATSLDTIGKKFDEAQRAMKSVILMIWRVLS